VDGAYFRVHHFARQLGSPFPLLAACGVKTKRIEIGTAVIDMRYENPLYMVEDAGAADVIGGRLRLGISRGSPEQVIDGWRHFGYVPPEGMTDADMARRHTEALLEVLRGEGFARPNQRPMFPNPPGLLRVEPDPSGALTEPWDLYLFPRASCCACHSSGKGFRNRWSCHPGGWRPSRIISTRSGASKVSRSTSATYEASIPSLTAISLIVL
jgi:hypothetical protein